MDRVRQGETYEKENAYRAKRAREMSDAGRDIGPLPEIVNKERRAICQRDFRLFCESYHADLFSFAWSADHLRVIERIEQSVLDGGQFGMAMPRGSGKTTLCCIAAEWALLYGHRSFVLMIGAEATSSLELLDAIRTDLENNEQLADDFPEVVHPIRSLQGISHRCNGQTLDGERTQMTWTSDRVIFPTVAGSKASGAAVRVCGITGRIRGMMSRTPAGETIRPDLVIIDDPQTDESSRSASQNDQRERLLAGTVLGLAGPGKTIAAIMPCTVINSQDMADRILDRDRHPEWRGERTKLVTSWPKNQKLWDKYADIWAGDLRNGGNGSVATDFYREQREAMDLDFNVSWPARFEAGELSAQQHAMNLKLRVGEDAFQAEYQNEPSSYADSLPVTLTSDDIAAKVSGVKHRVVPADCQQLTAMIDISQKCLWYAVAAWGDGFTGSVIDYGTWPDQGKRYVTLKQVSKTLQRRYKGAGIEGAILQGLEDLVDFLAMPWTGESGTEHRIEKILIDEGDGEHTPIVRNFCRRSAHSAILLPSKGRGIKASSKKLCEGKPRTGERFGTYWKLVRNRDRTKSIHVDVNYWKTFAYRRFEGMKGDRGSLTLYQQTPRHHQMFADQFTAERCKEIEDVGTGNRVIEWQNYRHHDNHLMDCVVGCLAAASLQGCQLSIEKPMPLPGEKTKSRKRKVSYL